MTVTEMLLTFFGDFILPFTIILLWGRLVKKWYAFGGFIAAFVIVGLIWILNHGMEQSFITQTGTTFIDMGLATAVGVFVHGICNGGKIKQSLINVFAAVIGGSLAGILLALMI